MPSKIKVGTTRRGIKAKATVAEKTKDKARQRKPPVVGEIVDSAEGLFTRRDNLRSDMDLVRRGIKERWEIPPEVYQEVPKVLRSILKDENPETGEQGNYVAAVRVKAGQVLATLHGQNQKDQHHEEGEQLNVNHTGAVLVGVEQRQSKLSAIAGELGVKILAEETPQEAAK